MKGWLANLSVVLAALAGIAALLYAVRALFFAQTRAASVSAKPVAAEPDQRELARLEDERRRLLNHLREIQFDHDTGKLDRHDYERLRQRYEGEALAVLEDLDALKLRLSGQTLSAAIDIAPDSQAGSYR